MELDCAGHSHAGTERQQSTVAIPEKDQVYDLGTALKVDKKCRSVCREMQDTRHRVALKSLPSSRKVGRILRRDSGCRSRSNSKRIHVAAVCYRVRSRELEFLLVRTKNGHWTFPKGAVGEDATNADAAAREAYEEAGVKGQVEHTPFVSYLHCKPRRLRSRRQVVLVDAHLCEVRRLVPPQELHRDPTWFSASKAKRRLREYRTPEYAAEVIRVIDRAMERIVFRRHKPLTTG